MLGIGVPVSQSKQSPRGASRTTGGQIGHQKEYTMRVLRFVVILTVLATVGPLNAAAQAPTVASPAPVSIPSGGLAKCEPVTCLVAPSAQSNCELGGGVWDATKAVPKSQSAVDERCNLEKKNEDKTDEFDRSAFCNDPDDKSSLRRVYTEAKCDVFRARRADRARTETRIATAIAGLQPPDLKPLEAKVGENEIETARIDGELKTLAGGVELLESRTEAVEAEVKRLSDRLADSPACAALRTTEDLSKFLESEEGKSQFKACLDDPKTDPVARVAVYQAWSALSVAGDARVKAEDAKASAARALHIGVGLYVSGALVQPLVAPATGQTVSRGTNGVGPGLAVLLYAEQLHVEVALGYLREDRRDNAGRTFSTNGLAGQLRTAYVWPTGTEHVYLGVTGAIRAQGTDFFALAPSASAFAFGVGVGGRAELHFGDFRVALDLDVLSWDWASASVNGSRVAANGYVLPVRLVAGVVF